MHRFVLRSKSTVGYSKSSLFILSRSTLLPIKIFDTSGLTQMKLVGFNFIDNLARFLVPNNNIAYTLNLSYDLLLTSSVSFVNADSSSDDISIEDLKQNSNLGAYFIFQIIKDANSSDSYTYSSTIKTNADYSPSNWDALDFNLNSRSVSN